MKQATHSHGHCRAQNSETDSDAEHVRWAFQNLLAMRETLGRALTWWEQQAGNDRTTFAAVDGLAHLCDFAEQCGAGKAERRARSLPHRLEMASLFADHFKEENERSAADCRADARSARALMSRN